LKKQEEKICVPNNQKDQKRAKDNPKIILKGSLQIIAGSITHSIMKSSQNYNKNHNINHHQVIKITT
jgi:hypothetical protein